MADNTLPVRLQLRYDTLSRWMNSNVILKEGEAAVAVSDFSTINNTDAAPANTPPAVGIKIGNGYDRFPNLPWLQGVAGDVYSWAKQASKPTYTADEIQNLVTWIDDRGGFKPSYLYQIVKGTGRNANKYYLQYKEVSSGSWITDTTHAIDLTSFAEVVEWIGDDVYNFTSLGGRTEIHIQSMLNTLDFPTVSNPMMTGEPIDHYVITQVTQTNGLLSAVRSRLSFVDITGIVPVTQGGTGLASLPEGEALIGNGENNIVSLAIDNEVLNNGHLVTNRAIKYYVDQATAPIDKAMHFIGEATVDMTLPGAATRNPVIDEYNFAQARPGDVITFNNQELLWTGSGWRIFGDENAYIKHGEVRNADIHDEAAIAQSKIAGLADSFNLKVDKVEGKGLSTRDYTDEDWYKLQNIEAGAQVNVIEHIFVNGTERFPTTIDGITKAVGFSIEVFDPEHMAKLDAIEDEAQVNVIEHVFVNGVEAGVTTIEGKDKSVLVSFNPYTVEEQNKLRLIEDEAQVNLIEHFMYNGRMIEPTTISGSSKTISLEVREYPLVDANKLATISEGAQVNTIEHIFVNNVEQQIGVIQSNPKSVNIEFLAYTQTERDKLEAIAEGAQVNAIEHIWVNGTERPIETLAGVTKSVSITFLPYTVEEQNKLGGIESGAQVNLLEKLIVNGTTYEPNASKVISLTLNRSNLDVTLVDGAIIPKADLSGWDAVEIVNKQLVLARIADTGNVNDLQQSNDNDDYVILYCGTSVEVMDDLS